MDHIITVTSDRWAECSCGIIFTGGTAAERANAHAEMPNSDSVASMLMDFVRNSGE